MLRKLLMSVVSLFGLCFGFPYLEGDVQIGMHRSGHSANAEKSFVFCFCVVFQLLFLAVADGAG